MEPYVTETYENEKWRVKIIADNDPLNPRKEFDNMFTMVCWHSRYNLGDEHNFSSPEDFVEWAKSERGLIIQPLFLFDHSGLSISTSSGKFRAVDQQGWDWGQVGWIYCTREIARKEMMVKRLTKKIMATVLRNLEIEVEIYDQYLQGDVWGFTIEDLKLEEERGSVWGFYGSDPKENGMWDHWSEEIRKLVDPKYMQNPEGYWLDYQLELPLAVNGN